MYASFFALLQLIASWLDALYLCKYAVFSSWFTIAGVPTSLQHRIDSFVCHAILNWPSNALPLRELVDTFNVIFSSSQDWKAQLNIPAPDTRFRTEVSTNDIMEFHSQQDSARGAEWHQSADVRCTDVLFCNVFGALLRMLLQRKATSLKIIF